VNSLRTLRSLARHRRQATGLALVSFGMAVVSALLPVVVSWGVSPSVVDDDGRVKAIVVAVFLIGVAVWGLNRVRAYLTKRLVAEAVLDIRLAAARSALRRDLAYYDRMGKAQVLSRLTNDLDTFTESATAVLEAVQQLLVIVVLLPLLFALSWQLTLLTLAGAAAIVWGTRRFRRRSNVLAGEAAHATGDLTTAVTEALNGHAMLRALGRQSYAARLAHAANDRSRAAGLRGDLTAASLLPLLVVLTGLTTAGVVVAGGVLTGAAVITVATWYLFLLALDRFTFLLAASASIDGQIQTALASVSRVYELIDDDEPDSAGDAGVQDGHVLLRDVSMHYTSGVHALRSISLEIPAGAHVGLVGPSGAGKTTLLRILGRLHPYQEGQVLIDGRRLEDFGESWLRRTVSFLPQRPQLLDGTVADNIRLSGHDRPDLELEALAHRAGLGGWLDGLPQGLHTPVGRGGLRLSLGQRQLVALLRALAKRPRLVLLDEPTANVDQATDLLVRQALRRLLDGATCVMIAHRLSTMRSLDLIVVIERGRIVEVGTHDRLSTGAGRYAGLFESYLREHVDESR